MKRIVSEPAIVKMPRSFVYRGVSVGTWVLVHRAEDPDDYPGAERFIGRVGRVFQIDGERDRAGRVRLMEPAFRVRFGRTGVESFFRCEIRVHDQKVASRGLRGLIKRQERSRDVDRS